MAAGLARSNPGGYLWVLLPCMYVLLPDLLVLFLFIRSVFLVLLSHLLVSGALRGLL